MKIVLSRKQKSWLTTEGTESTETREMTSSVPSVVKFFCGLAPADERKKSWLTTEGTESTEVRKPYGSVSSVASVVLRFNFSVPSEEIATRTKEKEAGEGLNHRGHRERHFDFPLCPLCPLWLPLLQSWSSFWFRLRRSGPSVVKFSFFGFCGWRIAT